MKIIVTHMAPDLDAVASSWIIKKFLPGWENSEHKFVPAGKKLAGKYLRENEVIEKVAFDNGDEAEVIHVDTGMGPLDHHQTEDDKVSATSRAYEYVLMMNEEFKKDEVKSAAVKKIVDFAVSDDHFQEVFFPNPEAEIYDFSIVSLIHGIKMIYPKEDLTCLNFGMEALDAALHNFENKVWAEEEIKNKAEDLGIIENENFLKRIISKHIALPVISETVLVNDEPLVISIFSSAKDPHKAKNVVLFCEGTQDKMILTRDAEALIYAEKEEDEEARLDEPHSQNIRLANWQDLDRYENALKPMGNIYPVIRSYFEEN